MFKLTPKQKFVGENLKEKTSLRGPQKEGSEPWESLKERGPKEFTSDLLKLVKDPKVWNKTTAELEEMKSQDKKLPKGDNQEEKGTETIPLDKGLQTT